MALPKNIGDNTQPCLTPESTGNQSVLPESVLSQQVESLLALMSIIHFSLP
jgi:hypothetical protein